MAADMSAYSSQIRSYLQSAESEFRYKLEDLQKDIVVLGWRGLPAENYIDAIGDITFGSVKDVASLVDTIEFTPVPSKDFQEDVSIDTTHVFESSELDAIEVNLGIVVTRSGVNSFKAIDSAMISKDNLDMLREGMFKEDSKTASDCVQLINIYKSDDTLGNEDWFNLRHSYKLSDRDKSIYKSLFELAQTNMEFVYRTQFSIEKLHANFTAQYSRLVFSLTKANLAAYKAEVDANIEQLRADLRKVQTEIDVNGLALKRDSAEYTMLIRQANSRVDNYVTNYRNLINHNLNLLSARIDGGNNVAEGYKGIFNAYSQQYTGFSAQEV